jgi:septal ring factor EnvC (AmiA/AmiB activator)
MCLRIQKARLKSLTKQLDESKELRKQLMEQINDMQRQLKTERDDNKQLRKRWTRTISFPLYVP